MVLHKRLDNGSSGYQVPPMPRVPRSAKGKRSVRKKLDEKQITAFDLLATVAGELYSQRENSPPPSTQPGSLDPIIDKDAIKHVPQAHEMPFKAEVFDQGSCNESTCCSENLPKRQACYALKEHQLTLKSIHKDGSDLLIGGKRIESECALPPIAKTEGLSSHSKDFCDSKPEVVVKTPLRAERRMSGNVDVVNGNYPEILEDPMDLDTKPPALVSSDSSVEVAVSHSGFFPKCGVNREPLVDRDDDENSSGCTHPGAKYLKAFRPQRIGDRRIRKLLASKYWKSPITLKDGELADGEMKPVFRTRKLCYTRQRTQRSSFKRRKLFERSSISASNGGIYGEAMPSSLKLGGIKVESSDALPSVNGANGASSSTSGQKSYYESGDYRVKLRIKSFKVPELFVEIPETATVGSLKKTVMEAVTAILAGGLRVGVLFQGKKVRDDKQTLLQAGISCNDKVENLGFTLEPNSAQRTPTLTCTEDPSFLLPPTPAVPCPSAEPIQSILPAPPLIEQAPVEAAPEPPQALNLDDLESDHESVHSPNSASLSEEKTSESKAMVPVPAVNADPLAAVPLRKSKRPELVQRRIRRPFSVTEVEALVHAVEKIGTGRWRDVKIRAFDNAKHRTYVDLKDKWKTLVHTAKISPQQRRGEPVPQELLDRVLTAHAHWTQHQAKLQVKLSQG